MGNGPVIHDRRRIDPVTGQVREPDRPRGKHAASEPGGHSRGGNDPARTPGPEPIGYSRGNDPGRTPGGAKHGRGAGPVGSAPGPDPEDQAGDDLVAEGAGNGSEGRTAPSGETGNGEEVTKLKGQLADRTADLQRLQAEYANYRKRVDRDRGTVRELAVSNVLSELLPSLDAVGQARQHDELSGAFKSVADSLESATSKLGLATYGEKGDPFDPKIHEALTHTYSPDVTEVTCVEIFQPGYTVGDRILRPARVAVAEPATGPDGAAEGGADTAGQPSGQDGN
jgi:molecular chaperone GrpE